MEKHEKKNKIAKSAFEYLKVQKIHTKKNKTRKTQTNKQTHTHTHIENCKKCKNHKVCFVFCLCCFIKIDRGVLRTQFSILFFVLCFFLFFFFYFFFLQTYMNYWNSCMQKKQTKQKKILSYQKVNKKKLVSKNNFNLPFFLFCLCIMFSLFYFIFLFFFLFVF